MQTDTLIRNQDKSIRTEGRKLRKTDAKETTEQWEFSQTSVSYKVNIQASNPTPRDRAHFNKICVHKRKPVGKCV